VRVLTLPDYDVTQTLYGDTLCGKPSIVAFRNISRLNYMEIDYSHICGILAAPPCTEFSIAKSTAPRDLAEGMRIVRACLDLIWHCQIHGRLKFWALENPKGLLVRFLGKPAFKFEQWQFGGTLEKPKEYEQYVAGFTGYKEKRAAIRAITPAGFAEAFYKANKLTEVRS